MKHLLLSILFFVIGTLLFVIHYEKPSFNLADIKQLTEETEELLARSHALNSEMSSFIVEYLKGEPERRKRYEEQTEADRLEMLASLKQHKANAVARGSKHADIWDRWIEAKENE